MHTLYHTHTHPHTHTYPCTHTHTHKLRYENLKKEWERMRALIGSKWCWLERKISELNKQICHLDWKMQRRPNRIGSTFKIPQTPPAPTPYLTLSNGGALLEQIHRSGSKTGSNGVNSQFLPQLLLPGGISSSKLQVGMID